MFKIARYISKAYLITWLTLVFGFLTLIGLLDSLANGSDIVKSGGGFSDTFRYMFLRAPVIFDRIFVFTLIVAILMTFVKFIRQHELVAFLGFGLSAAKQTLLMTPAVVGAAVLSVIFIDLAMAPAVRSLQTWGIGEYKVKNITEKNPLWIEDNGNIIRATTRLDFETLGDLNFFFRNENGTVTKIWHVGQANYKTSNWELSNIQELEIKGEANLERDLKPLEGTRIWDTRQTPESCLL